MGPFKHTVDDGLDVRKAAFECMYTLLDSCVQQLDVFEFLNHVELGLKDSYDIKVKPTSVWCTCYRFLCVFIHAFVMVDKRKDSSSLSPICSQC